MAKKIKEFEAFGVKYKVEQFSAIRGLDFIGSETEIHPCSTLSQTYVFDFETGWVCLSNSKEINARIIDKANVVPPRIVLDGILSIVNEFNFGFLANWKSAKVPARFLEESKSIVSNHVDPMTLQLIQDDVASLKELEEYYSLEDAFKLFDAIMVKGINQALSQEFAAKKNKR